MATTVSSGFEKPSNIFITTTGVLSSGYPDWIETSARRTMVADADGFKSVTFGWASNHNHWQVQVKRRRRLSPAKAATVTQAEAQAGTYVMEGSDWWEPWPAEWTDLFSGDNETNCNRVRTSAAYVAYMTDYISVPYSFAEYDRWDYIVRVRVLDVRTLMVTDWVESEVLSVCFCPRFTAASAEYTARGEWAVDVTMNWPRGGNSMTTWGVFESTTRDDGALLTPNNRDVFTYRGLDGGKFGFDRKAKSTDAEAIHVNMRSFATSDMQVPDEAGYYLRSFVAGDIPQTDIEYPSWRVPFVAQVGTHIDPTGVDADITASADGASLAVSVESTGSAVPEAVICNVSWTDYSGNPVTADVELSTADGGAIWSGMLDVVPFDTELAVSASVVKDGLYRLVSTTAAVPSNGLAVLSWPGYDGIALRFNPERSNDYSMNGEAVQTAGRELPVARYGIGGELQLALSGILLDPSEPCGSATAAAAEPLKERHDWIVRYPGGEMYRAAVLSHSLSSTYSTGHRQVELSLRMEALGYGVD